MKPTGSPLKMEHRSDSKVSFLSSLKGILDFQSHYRLLSNVDVVINHPYLFQIAHIPAVLFKGARGHLSVLVKFPPKTYQ